MNHCFIYVICKYIIVSGIESFLLAHTPLKSFYVYFVCLCVVYVLCLCIIILLYLLNIINVKVCTFACLLLFHAKTIELI